MRTDRLALGPLDTNCYVVTDEEAGAALVIDPAGFDDRLLAAIGESRVVAIMLTHCHFDHLGGVARLKATTGAPLVVHAQDAAFVTSSEDNGGAMFGFVETAPPADRVVEDGDVIACGSIDFEVMHTPGHTPGGICLYTKGHLFSGDTLFAGSVGRTDFPRGDGRALARSVATKVAVLPDETVVHPGHGPESTIGRERRVNPFFPRA